MNTKHEDDIDLLCHDFRKLISKAKTTLNYPTGTVWKQSTDSMALRNLNYLIEQNSDNLPAYSKQLLEEL